METAQHLSLKIIETKYAEGRVLKGKSEVSKPGNYLLFSNSQVSLSYVWFCWHKDLWQSSEKSHIFRYFILRLNEWREFTFPGIFYSSPWLKSWLWGEEGSADTELILTLHSSPRCCVCLGLFWGFVIPVGPT